MKYHIKLDKSMIEGSEHVILPGDPGRVKKTALLLDPQAKPLASNREFTSYLATLNNKKIVVCSTGIGGPSVSIALEELAALGLKYFFRIGTTGAIQPDIKVPSLIITTGAVRLDGASTHYAPIEYPAVADIEIVNSLIAGAKATDSPCHVGITASSDTFYPGQERYDTFTGYVPKKFQNSFEEWKRLSVLNYEMESATLLTIINTFGLHAGCISVAIVNRNKEEAPDDSILEKSEQDLAIAIKKALEYHIDNYC